MSLDALHLTQDDIDAIHDAILSATGKNLSNNEVINYYEKLPEDIQFEIVRWGANDTPTRESIYTFFKDKHEDSERDITVLYPGGFKPLHGGHINLINGYANIPEVKEIKVIISPKARGKITQNLAFNIAKLLTANMPKVTVEKSIYYTPILSAYKFMEKAPKGYYAFASSRKDDDYERVKEFIEKHKKGGPYHRNGVNVIELTLDVDTFYYTNRSDKFNGKPIAGNVAREDLTMRDYVNFRTNYPQTKESKIKEVWHNFVNTL